MLRSLDLQSNRFSFEGCVLLFFGWFVPWPKLCAELTYYYCLEPISMFGAHFYIWSPVMLLFYNIECSSRSIYTWNSFRMLLTNRMYSVNLPLTSHPLYHLFYPFLPSKLLAISIGHWIWLFLYLYLWKGAYNIFLYVYGLLHLSKCSLISSIFCIYQNFSHL